MIVISDVHGKVNKYFAIADKHKYTVQLGDFGFSDAWNKLEYSGLAHGEHVVIPGNHDDYDICMNSSYCLGDFGEVSLDQKFFFVRGGLSIDMVFREAERIRTGLRTYWPQEQLTYNQMKQCELEWAESDTEILIAHCPPARLIPLLHKDQRILVQFGFPETFVENTSLLIESMISTRKPKLVVSGHHHKSYNKIIEGVRYVVLNELETFEC